MNPMSAYNILNNYNASCPIHSDLPHSQQVITIIHNSNCSVPPAPSMSYNQSQSIDSYHNITANQHLPFHANDLYHNNMLNTPQQTNHQMNHNMNALFVPLLRSQNRVLNHSVITQPDSGSTCSSYTLLRPTSQNFIRDSSISQCEIIRRVIRLSVLHSKYIHSDAVLIAHFIDNCKEYMHLNDDYAHFMAHALTSHEQIQMNKITQEYDKIYQFIRNFRNIPSASCAVHRPQVTVQYLEYLNANMRHMYEEMCGKAQPCNVLIPKQGNSCTELEVSPVAFVHQNIPPLSQSTSSLQSLQTLSRDYEPSEISATKMPKIEYVEPLTLHRIKDDTVSGGLSSRENTNTFSHIKSEQVSRVNIPKKYKCTECDKEYKHLCNLKSHQKVHTDEALICTHCKKRFGRKANYVEHLRIHTGETPYQCRFCLRKFKHHHSWKDHLRIHTGENPYQCKVCFKRFKVGHNLTVHLRIHTGEKPYQCKLCQKFFRQKSGLNSHVKRIHNT